MLKNLSNRIANMMQSTMSTLDFAPLEGCLKAIEKKLGIRINGSDIPGIYN